MYFCTPLGDHGECECTTVNSPSGPPGPAGDRGDAGMAGEFGQQGDSGDPGPQGNDGFPVRVFFFYHNEIKKINTFHTLTLGCFLGLPWFQWGTGPKRPKGRDKCGHTERCCVYVISPHFRLVTVTSGP